MAEEGSVVWQVVFVVPQFNRKGKPVNPQENFLPFEFDLSSHKGLTDALGSIAASVKIVVKMHLTLT